MTTNQTEPDVDVSRFPFVVSKFEFPSQNEGESEKGSEGTGESGGEGSEGGGNA